MNHYFSPYSEPKKRFNPVNYRMPNVTDFSSSSKLIQLKNNQFINDNDNKLVQGQKEDKVHLTTLPQYPPDKAPAQHNLYFNDHIRKQDPAKQSLPSLKPYSNNPRIQQRSITEAESDSEPYSDYKKRWEGIKNNYTGSKGLKNASTSFDKSKVLGGLDIMTPKEMISLRTPILEGKFDMPMEESQRKFLTNKLAPLNPIRDSNIGNPADKNNKSEVSYHTDKSEIKIHNQIVIKFAQKSVAGINSERKQKTNQDTVTAVPNLLPERDSFFFAVSDGHGTHGHQVSDYIKKNLPNNIIKSLKNISKIDETDMRVHLNKAFHTTNHDLINSKIDCALSGSTTVSVFIGGNGKLWCANVGDSRAVLCKLSFGEWKVLPLSIDHKPDLPNEKMRILKKGGRVHAQKFNGLSMGPVRVWLKNFDLPGLAMSRSMGDTIGAQAGVISEPEILEKDLVEEDKIIVLASDGVWEFMSNNEVMNIVVPYYERQLAEQAAERLVDEAIYKWKKEDDVRDDISALVLFLTIHKK